MELQSTRILLDRETRSRKMNRIYEKTCSLDGFPCDTIENICYGQDDNQMRATMFAQSIRSTMQQNNQITTTTTSVKKLNYSRRKVIKSLYSIQQLILATTTTTIFLLIQLASHNDNFLMCNAQSSVVRPTKFTDVKTSNTIAAPQAAVTTNQQASNQNNNDNNNSNTNANLQAQNEANLPVASSQTTLLKQPAG